MKLIELNRHTPNKPVPGVQLVYNGAKQKGREKGVVLPNPPPFFTRFILRRCLLTERLEQANAQWAFEASEPFCVTVVACIRIPSSASISSEEL